MNRILRATHTTGIRPGHLPLPSALDTADVAGTGGVSACASGRSGAWRATRLLAVMCALVAAMAVLLALPAGARADEAGTSEPAVVADDPTDASWDGLAAPSTRDVGRVWVDKSVYTGAATLGEGVGDGGAGGSGGVTVDKTEGADFLVSLSALSSTMALETQGAPQPLDIVLVLDRSGSMKKKSVATYAYEPAYADQVSPDGSVPYFAQNADGSYAAIAYHGDGMPGRWELDGRVVEPAAGPDDAGGGRVVFHTRTERSDTLINVLKQAVGDFIDTAAAQENADLNRIALIGFSTKASVVSGLMPVTPSNAEQLKSIVGGIQASGDTYPDAAFDAVQGEYEAHGRGGAKRVVVFFTDGVPAEHGAEEFNDVFAATAVNIARLVKDGGTTVYAIGVVEGADPAVTDDGDFNAYMNAVSSNFPHATAEGNDVPLPDPADNVYGRSPDDCFRVDWGTGSTDRGYYLAADDAEDLRRIFRDIAGDIAVPASAPVRVAEGADPLKDGYITFTDTLGDYLEVKGVNAVVSDCGSTTGATRTDNGDGTETYTFAGPFEGSNMYPAADLANVGIAVSRGAGARGDTVTVRIPASFIPLHRFDVAVAADGSVAMDETPACPIRVLYSVGLRDGVAESLADPDEALASYIAANTGEGGTVRFYANDYVPGVRLGSATARFEPAVANAYYRFATDTPLYVRTADGAYAAATGPCDPGATYAYRHTYYAIEGGRAAARAEYLPVDGRDIEGRTFVAEDGQLTVAAGTPKADLAARGALDKLANPTQTVPAATAPSWDAVGGTVGVALGNNGRLAAGLPATLRVTKEVAVDPALGGALDAGAFSDRGFDVTVHADALAGQAASAHVENERGEVVGDASFAVAFDEKGDYTHTLRAGETLVVAGLRGGASYRVTEGDPGAGFSASYDAAAAGTLATGGTVETTVTNTYRPEPLTMAGSAAFAGEKVLVGRPWAVGDSFTFELSQTGGPVVDGAMVEALPDETARTVTAPTGDGPEGGAGGSAAFSFGDVTYTVPGTYTYAIVEDIPQNGHPGMGYTGELYTVRVVVSDNGDGTMTATPTMERMAGASDGSVAAEPVEGGVASFTNRFTVTKGSYVVRAAKQLDNRGGDAAHDLASNMFTAELRPVTAGAPMPAGATDDGQGPVAAVNNAGGMFVFAPIAFDNTMKDETFRYRIAERHGGETVDGVAYDGSVYYVDVTVRVSDANEVGFEAVYTDDRGGQVVDEAGAGTHPTFHNVYDPEDAELSPAGGGSIHGTKALVGRDMRDGETFYFELAERPGNPAAVLSGGPVVATATKDAPSFDFGSMSFSRAGTYRFTVREVADAAGTPLPRGAVDGMTYDAHVCAVTVEVAPQEGDAGRLAVTVSYDNGAGLPVDGAAFENRYEARMTYGAKGAGGLVVEKTLSGRPMEAGEFAFAIAGADAGVAGGATAAEADAKLAPSDARFENGAAPDGAADAMAKLGALAFDQDDAGKTFVYTVDEVDGDLPGVAYDPAVYTVAIEVFDDGDGTMHAVTTVKDAAGGLVAGPVTWDDHAIADSAAVTVAFANAYTPEPVEIPEGADTGLKVGKLVTGAPTQADFSFTLTLAHGDAAGVVWPGGDAALGSAVTDDFAAGETHEALFGTIGFTRPGLYVFKIVENEAQAGKRTWPLGWTYDTAAKYVSVVVTDENPAHGTGEGGPRYDGRLHIGRVSGNGQVFTNRYAGSSVTVGPDGEAAIRFTKTVTGAPCAGEAVFKLDRVDPDDAKWKGVVEKEGASEVRLVGFAAGETKTGTFGAYTFKKPGEYEFTVSEVSVGGVGVDTEGTDGWTYDRSRQTVKVVVTEENAAGGYDGHLHATVVGTPAFTNAFGAELDYRDAGGLKIVKTLEGHEMVPFSFTVTPDDEASAAKLHLGMQGATFTVKGGVTSGDGSSSVGEVAVLDGQAEASFTKDDFGATYSYTVREAVPDPAPAGYVFDGTVYTVSMAAVDAGDGIVAVTTRVQGGSFDRTFTYSPATDAEETAYVPFTNVYDATGELGGAGEARIEASKRLAGRDLKEGEFAFAMFNAAPGAGDEAVATGTNAADGTVELSAVPYSTRQMVADAEAGFATLGTDAQGRATYTYAYRVAEVGEMPAGVAAQTDGYDVAVTVTDRGDGTLGIAVGYPDGADSLVFVNTYGAGETGTVTVPFAGAKVLAAGAGAGTVPTLASVAGRYTFVLSAEPGAPLPDAVEATNDAAGTVDFGSATYTMDDLAGAAADENGVRTRTFVYTVAERGSVAHIANGEAATFAVTLTDHGDGTLSAATEPGEAPLFTVTNTYEPEPGVLGGSGEAALHGRKTLTGRALREGEFSFALAAADEATAAAMADGSVVPSSTLAVNDAAGDFAFGPITFNAAGTYAFAVGEVVPRGADETGAFDGVTYDRHVATVEVAVVDDGQGHLRAAVQGDADVAFANTFAPQGQSAQVVPAVTKTLAGRAMRDGEFSFAAVDRATGATVSTGLVRVGDDGEPHVEMTPIVYGGTDAASPTSMAGAVQNPDGSLTKTFSYTIREVSGGAAGVTYDARAYTMTVEVTVNPDGSFAEPHVAYALGEGAEAQAVEGAAFANVYAASNPATFTPQGSKATVRQDGTDLGDLRFSFEVVDAAGDRVSEGWSAPDGEIEFGEIVLPRAAGTYTYTIRELDTGVAGVTADDAAYTLAVTVGDDGMGSYRVTGAAYTNAATGEPVDEARFTNTYDGGTVALNLSATKVLEAPGTDRALRAGEFGFTVYDETGAAVAHGTNDGDGAVRFGSIAYSYMREDAAPAEAGEPEAAPEDTATEDVPEDAGAEEGTDAAVGGEVPAGDDAGDGAAAADADAPEGSAEGAGAPAGNAVPAGGDGDDAADAGASGGEDGDGGSATGEEAPAGGEPVDAGDAAGTADAGDAADAADAGDAGEGAAGGTGPAAEVAALLAPDVAVADDAAAVAYAYEGVPAEGGSDAEAVADAGPASGTGPAARGEDAASPESAAPVRSTDLGVHRYRVCEDRGDVAGVTYDDTYYLVEVTVTDDVARGAIAAGVTKVVRCEPQADGTLVQTPVFDAASAEAGADPCAGIVFHNRYETVEPAQVAFAGTKTLTGRAMAAGEFGFEVLDDEGNQVASGLSAAADAGEASAIAFGTVEIARAGTYAYTIREVNAGETVDGVTYSTQVFRAVATATDDGAGGLAVEVAYPDGPVAFTNSYGVTGSVEVGFEATKTLTGRAMAEGEFSFAVYDAAGELVAGGQNAAAADGEAAPVRLGTVAFDAPGVYDFTIAEVAGGLGGVTYDGRAFRAQVAVEDGGDGVLRAEVSYPDGPAAFENGYGTVAGARAEVLPEASKTLAGRELADGEFTFAATDSATGEVAARGTNRADGTVVWDVPVAFTAAGDYAFAIAEVNGRKDGIAYDDASFRMLVSVSDDGAGGLVAEASYPDGLPRFANVYEEPVEPGGPDDPGNPGGSGGTPDTPGSPGTPGADRQVPKTGDPGAGFAGAAALAACGLGAMCGGAALVRRRAGGRRRRRRL